MGELTQDEAWAEEDRNFNMMIKWKGKTKFFAIHCIHIQETFGKFINHSKKHPNLRTKVMLHPDSGKPDVMFKALTKIRKGEQLCYDYGPQYDDLNPCVESCRKCSQ